MPGKKNKSKGDGGSAPATPRSEPAAGGAAADATEAEIEEEDDEVATGNKRDGADLSKVTDYVEQKELDSKKASEAIARMTAEMKVDREAEAQRGLSAR